MNILDQIKQHKLVEVSRLKREFNLSDFSDFESFESPRNSLAHALKQSDTGVIAEYKRKSPSKPIINLDLDVEQVITAYANNGATGISVLTDAHFFGGNLTDLSVARKTTNLPLLRKDFMLDVHQIHQAKAHGANCILLIAAMLDPLQLHELSLAAQEIDLDVLLEVHNQEELQNNLWQSVDIIGVNNRNLKDFNTSISTSQGLAKHIPQEYVKISESGIHTSADVKVLQSYGYQGFLIGERFMKHQQPGNELSDFINQIKRNEH